MYDSLVLRSASDQSALPECSQSWSNDYSGSEVSQNTLELQRFDGSLIQGRDFLNEARNRLSGSRRNRICPYRFQLEQDVQKLQEKLQEEMELHKILEHAFNKSAVKLSSTSCLPLKSQELLSNIAVLEVAVSKLENQMVALHFQLSQERNERRLAEYRLRHSSSGLKSLCMSDNLERMELRDQPSHPVGEICFRQPVIQEDRSARSDSSPHSENASTSDDARYSSSPKLFLTMNPLSGLWDYPNKLSEEMVRCMKNIFISLADSSVPCQQPSLSSKSQLSPLSPQGILSSSSWWSSSDRSQSLISSWVQSPQVDVQSNLEVLAVENACDPYRVRGKLSWADIGTYGLVIEVSWMSVRKKQLEYAAGALRKFRTLVEQLAKVNPIHLSNDEKLAFWINLYNAMIMHGYLAYGVPKSDLKLFSLMQKAAYTVGGHSFTATSIEFGILKMKSPLHRPQIALLLALHRMKMSEEQRKCGIDAYEPLVAFALSCGMYSSPAVRIYTAKNVREELEEAQLDYIRASVGVSSKGKLLVPKMVHCFAKSIVDDDDVGVWISHYLPGCQAAFVKGCVSQRRHKTHLTSPPPPNSYGILPFDSRFRYLFLPENMTSSSTTVL